VKKTLTIRPESERTEPPKLQKKGRGWNIAESRLDTLHETAREMRREPTPAQAALGEALIAANLGKYRLHRQVVIGSALVDFACKPLKIVVEMGIKVLRVAAAEVLADAEAVAAAIVAEMKQRYDEQRVRRPRPAPRAYQR
jgi:very-short-patch-repair endonuclease